MAVSLRKAVLADVPQIQALIARSARGLSTGDYTGPQIEAALLGAFGVDSQLLADETYFVAETGSRIVGCGGWSFRATLFGGDAGNDRDPTALDPTRHAAKVRAFFVDPSQARRGIGSLLLDCCEQAARAHGFRATELMATLPGARLYAARGYRGTERVRIELTNGQSIEFVPMQKSLL